MSKEISAAKNVFEPVNTGTNRTLLEVKRALGIAVAATPQAYKIVTDLERQRALVAGYFVNTSTSVLPAKATP